MNFDSRFVATRMLDQNIIDRVCDRWRQSIRHQTVDALNEFDDGMFVNNICVINVNGLII